RLPVPGRLVRHLSSTLQTGCPFDPEPDCSPVVFPLHQNSTSSAWILIADKSARVLGFSIMTGGRYVMTATPSIPAPSIHRGVSRIGRYVSRLSMGHGFRSALVDFQTRVGPDPRGPISPRLCSQEVMAGS